MKKILAIVAAFAIVGFNGFLLLEGASSYAAYDYGPSTTPAGPCTWDVTLDVLAEVAMDCTTTTVDMTPDIPGMSGGDATGGPKTCTVYTNSITGYSLKIQADTSPALASATDDFPNMTTVASTSIDCGVDVACFAFVVGGNYQGFNTTNQTEIASNTTSNLPAGTATNISFAAHADNGANLDSGAYSATISATASVNP